MILLATCSFETNFTVLQKKSWLKNNITIVRNILKQKNNIDNCEGNDNCEEYEDYTRAKFNIKRNMRNCEEL